MRAKELRKRFGMALAHKRYNISDHVCLHIAPPHLLGRKRGEEGIVRDNRQFINAVF